MQAVAVTRELGLDPGARQRAGRRRRARPPDRRERRARADDAALRAARAQGKKRGIATLCLGGGNGVGAWLWRRPADGPSA